MVLLFNLKYNNLESFLFAGTKVLTKLQMHIVLSIKLVSMF
jgi:hypothetical protein